MFFTWGWNQQFDKIADLLSQGFHNTLGESTPCIEDGHPTFDDGNPYT